MNNNLTEILSWLDLSDSKKATTEILEIYKEKKTCIIHFLYFANIVLSGLDKDSQEPNKEEYKKALHSGDLIFPDGIALKLLYKKYF